MHRLIPLVLALLSMAGCATVPVMTNPGQPSAIQGQPAERAARQFVQVVDRVEPVAEAECRRLLRMSANCDFLIVVDDRPGQEPNAFQTLDRSGRPILAFNIPLIQSVDNADELAFVMGHEASHHILGHLGRVQQDATIGAIVFSGLAAMTGADAQSVRSAEEFGASLGARTFTKNYELEADQLGTIVTLRAGFDPVRGAEFFTRLPDPGNRFLGTHPPNAARMEIVRRTAEAARAGGV